MKLVSNNIKIKPNTRLNNRNQKILDVNFLVNNYIFMFSETHFIFISYLKLVLFSCYLLICYLGIHRLFVLKIMKVSAGFKTRTAS